MTNPRRYHIWCNQPFGQAAVARLQEGIGAHQLQFRPGIDGPNSELASADIAFGRPAVESLLESTVLRWVQVGSAGYTPWDRQDLFERLRAQGAAFTRSSAVYSEPCAEHVLSFMLGWARRLPWALDDQRSARAWRYTEIRSQSRLLLGQSAVLFGFGSIGARLVELLTPFHMTLTGVREQVQGGETIATLSIDDPRLDQCLATADHVINLLPLNDSTRTLFDVERLRKIRPGAVFYNVGRGGTVDQNALLSSLKSGHLAAALLDVVEPEPLPAEHPLWSLPNCVITPHSAGGHHNEQERLVDHFLQNLRRFEQGEPLLDRVV